MTDLEVFRLSAKMCGHEVWPDDDPNRPKKYIGEIIIRKWHAVLLEWHWCVWNPFTNPAQRDECIDKLVELGCWFAIDGRVGRYHQNFELDSPDAGLSSNCPWREFPARALAEIGRKG